MDDATKRKLRTWKDNIKNGSRSVVTVTKHCKEDNFVQFLKTNYPYVRHQNQDNSNETRFIFWSNEQQQSQYRRFHDVLIVDGTAGKNIANWCYILGVSIDSEFKSEIVGQMIADSECKEAYAYFMRHLVLSGNTVGNTECPTHLEQGMVVPAIWLTDEDPGFISALKDFQEIFPGESTGFRCHWHLGKDVNKHIACIHEDHSKVHTLWESALYKTTEPGFEEALTLLLVAVEPFESVHDYFKNTLYPSRLRWAAYARVPFRTLKSNASGRVEGQNGIIAALCNRKTKLSDMIRCTHEYVGQQQNKEVCSLPTYFNCFKKHIS